MGAAARQDQPVFRAGTTLVEVSAIVTERGAPVRDLTIEDVEIRDEGVVQEVVAFEFVDLTTVEGPEQRRDFVLVVDEMHISPRLTRPTRDVVSAFIRALGPHDRLAIVNTGVDELVHQLSTDRRESDALVRRIYGQRSASMLPLEREILGRMTMEVLGSVSTALRGASSERRAVVLISEGFFALPEGMNRDDYNVGLRDAYMALLRDAALANVAVYPIDPRGLTAPFGAMGNALSMTTAAGVAGDMADRPFGSLGLLASATGGVLTVDTNELGKRIPQILQDSRQYYRLAYVQPDPPAGKSHPSSRGIDVRVNRPGVDVRARQRYAPVMPPD